MRPGVAVTIGAVTAIAAVAAAVLVILDAPDRYRPQCWVEPQELSLLIVPAGDFIVGDIKSDGGRPLLCGQYWELGMAPRYLCWPMERGDCP
jgi:hypothetical protein